MITLCGFKYKEIWLVDFEFSVRSGERPHPVCMVAMELRTCNVIRLWEDEIDMYAEFRNATNGLSISCGASLVGALAYFGLDGIDALEKQNMRDLVLRGGPWSDSEKQDVICYCEGDVLALKRLLERMAPAIDMPRALIRGRSMKAVARIEHVGIPIDVERLQHLRSNVEAIRGRLIKSIDKRFGVYENSVFRADRFERLLNEKAIPWPRLPSGRLALDRETFSDISKKYPEIAPIREVRIALAQLRTERITVGDDGRNRCLLSPFRSKTGRNQPGGEFIFGLASWFRGLIRPGPGWGLALPFTRK